MITVHPDQPVRLFPGLALVNFRMETLLQVKGENVLYFNVQDKDITLMTGCGHGGVLNLLNYFLRRSHGLWAICSICRSGGRCQRFLGNGDVLEL